jgi:hypothetical protein
VSPHEGVVDANSGPGDDFLLHANGDELHATAIPAGKAP